jgi:transposase, IS5 family
VIKRELRRRSAIEPVIGHMNTDGHSKTDGHLGRCHLKGRDGDAANVSSAPSATTFASSG